MDELKLYITNVHKIDNPTLDIIVNKTDNESTWLVYQCRENNKFYFTMINKESVIHSEAMPELVEELKK